MSPIAKTSISAFLASRNGQFILFKYAVYLLLVADIYLFALHGTPTQVLDTFAWVVMLALFEWELWAKHAGRNIRLETAAIRGTRALAYATILYSCGSFFLEGEWLCFANEATWILVVLSLQYGDRMPGDAVRSVVKALLYAALAAFMVFWGVEGELLDSYDAFLWIVAFLTIEYNVFGFEHFPLGEAERG